MEEALLKELAMAEDLSHKDLKALCKTFGVPCSNKRKSEMVQLLEDKARDLRWLWYEGLEERRAPELKARLKFLALDRHGRKAQLRERLKAQLRVELEELTVAELKARLRERQRKLGGRKADLVARVGDLLCEVHHEKRSEEASGVRDLVFGHKKPPPTVSVATWNVLNLNATSRHKSYDKVVSLLGRFDVVALQEVLSVDVMQFLQAKLGERYAYVMTPRAIGRTRKEFCAFLWDTKKVRLVQHGLFQDDDDLFERQPFVATFCTCDRRRNARQFDFTLMSLHVLFGKNESHRRVELTHLAQAARVVLEANGEERDLIVLGDFNFAPDDEGWQAMKDMGFRALFHDPVRTTVGSISLYDNIWLLPCTRKNFVRRQVIEFDKMWYGPDETIKARNEVSDHRPCVAVFRTDIDLDGDSYGSFDELAVQLEKATITE